MKNFVAIILVVMMVLSVSAFAANDELVGLLEADGLTAALRTHDTEKHPEANNNSKAEAYANLSSAMMDMNSGRLDYLACEKTTADYILARNENLEIFTGDRLMAGFAMLTMEDNREVYDIINNAIIAMRDDGALDKLVENELKAYINSDPEAKDLPVFEGAKTIKVGITGDLPPMDFIAANGKAAGFNVALLTEIANRAQVNFELVQIETGARPMALSSGKVDVVFWTKSLTCAQCNETFYEEIPGTIATECYFFDASSVVIPKA